MAGIGIEYVKIDGNASAGTLPVKRESGITWETPATTGVSQISGSTSVAVGAIQTAVDINGFAPAFSSSVFSSAVTADVLLTGLLPSTVYNIRINGHVTVAITCGTNDGQFAVGDGIVTEITSLTTIGNRGPTTPTLAGSEAVEYEMTRTFRLTSTAAGVLDMKFQVDPALHSVVDDSTSAIWTVTLPRLYLSWCIEA